MKIRTHIATGVLGGALMVPVSGRGALAFCCAAAFADLDLYAYHVVRHRSLSLRAAARYYSTLAGRRERPFKALHHPAVLLGVFSAGRRYSMLRGLALGLSLHAALDGWGKWRHAGLVRTLRARSGGACELCGRYRSPIARMEPLRIDPASARHTPEAWLLVCRPCNDRRHADLGAA